MAGSGAPPLVASGQQSAPAPQPVPGILTFVFADLTVFAMLFTGFMVDRSSRLAMFNESANTLDFRLGILNLLILVTSGICVVFAVTAAREGRVVAIRNWLLAAFVIGAGFGVSKMVEYGDKFDHGISMHTNEFYMYYFALTGAHFLHFLGGMVALAFIWFQSFRYATDGNFRSKIEAIGLYWHMVDLLWILIFPLLYVLGLGWRAGP
ncbi:MAG: cytochrome c oxidase subunit 3 [Panacagrimonas sp.]